ncbi:DUF2787 domain-containing protein [Colwellia psychrerythraea]|uniref:DUF2787 domain-containing protein n=1 Tax=Colwellia psychrerythraea (strain 34H / ATCC BAA-681) TaxID=167879 RepID=Q47ZX0_COLP3|nr:DUF2787 domain-containing protein [Colwellia psychrerythraea]AAZ28218.1 hypothetical protein CPS_2949 [Colwellia psychrerythraea 34H]
MKLNFNKSQGFTLPVTLYSLLNITLTTLVSDKDLVHIANANAITFNFRNENYSASNGGYHPVEIRIEKEVDTNGSEQWHFNYITDFSYQGNTYPELVKEVDVCFAKIQVYSLYGGWLNDREAKSLLKLFIDNFIHCFDMGVYKACISTD